MGYGTNKGILPIVSTEIFQKVRTNQSDDHVYQIACSYMEIYGRELRDLLNPKGKEKLKIRNGKQARRRPAPPRAAPRSAASRHARRAGGPGSSEGSWLTAPVAHGPRSSRPP